MIDLPTIQKKLNLHYTLSLDLFGSEVSTNAANAFNAGVKGRYRETQIEDDHLPFIQAGVPAVDLIDLEYPAWHTAGDTLDAVSAGSLQVVGDVLLAALPNIEARLSAK